MKKACTKLFTNMAPFKIERPSSGVIVHPAGWIVTLLELLREVEQGAGYELKVKIAGHGEVPAKLVHKDEELGLALTSRRAGQSCRARTRHW